MVIAYWILSVSIVSICVALYAYTTSLFTSPPATTLEEIEAILNPQGADEHSNLRARALPNARLISTFDLRNTFVTDCTYVHHTFVKDAKSLLKHWHDDWRKFAEVVEFVTNKYLAMVQQKSNGSLPFDDFVQAVTFSVILMTFFETDPIMLEFDDVVSVTQRINRRWIDSKTMKLSGESLEEMNVHLRRWVPTSTYPTPLDFIIPSFETMWRTVAITLAYEHRNSQAHLLCNNFIANPVHSQLEQSYDGKGYSILAMILETLRLHPPTRHILRSVPVYPSLFHRVFTAVGIPHRKRCVADVEIFQRSAAWGPNPHMYNPLRHTNEEVFKNREAMILAFGMGPMQCIARKVAPHAAGILFSAIMTALPLSGSLVIDSGGGTIGSRDGWGTWKLRDKNVKC